MPYVKSDRRRKAITFVYDFAVQGGGTGAKTLVGEDGKARVLPAGALVVGAYIEPVTTVTSGGAATVKLGITGNDDSFKAATAYNDASYNTTFGAATAETPLKVGGSAVSVLATIATAALTAGKFKVHVEVLLP